MQKNERFYTLDLLRGVGALFVLVCHFGQTTGWPHIIAPDVKNVAVDFFFCLSGFVICQAYEQRLKAGMSVRKFMLARVVRLYPIYLLGLVAGALSIAPALVRAGGLDDTARVFAGNLFMIPLPGAQIAKAVNRPDFLFPFDPVAWSLLFELLVNLVFAAGVFRLGRRGLLIVAAAAAAALAAAILYFGSNEIGWSMATGFGGLARAAFGFTAGWLVGRIFDPKARRVRPIASMASVAGFFLATLTVVPPALRPVYEILAVVFAAPAVVWLGSVAELPVPFRRLAAWAGDLSYPLYMLHVVILSVLATANRQVLHLPPAALGVLMIGLSLLVSWVALVAFDVPMRAWIDRQLKARRTPAPRLATA